MSVSLLDRFFKNKLDPKEISDLHIIGVTSMFIASKYEDIYPVIRGKIVPAVGCGWSFVKFNLF